MKVRAILAGITLAAGLLLTPNPAADAATGAISCSVISYGVKTPTPIADAGEGSGFFGSVRIGPAVLESTMICKGTYTGTVQVTGDFTWCHQSTDHNPATNPYVPSTPDPDPTDFDCNGVGAHADPETEALYPEDLPTNVHIVANAQLSNTNWIDVNGDPGPSVCDVTLEGHGSTPTALDTTMTCGSDVFEGVVSAGFTPILGPAGDAFEHPSDPSQNPTTCADSGHGVQCFRALAFEGTMDVAALDV